VLYPYIGPKSKIHILGYAGNQGNSNFDDTISMHRVENIAQYLIQKGVNKVNITGHVSHDEIVRDKNKAGAPDFDVRVDVVIIDKIVPEKPAPVVVAKAEPSKPFVARKRRNVSAESIRDAEVGESLDLEMLNFIGGSYEILPDSRAELDKLLDIMQTTPTLKIQIEGHVCCTKPGRFDGEVGETGVYNLSVRRALYVYDYLVANGIMEDRLSYKGFGSSRLLEGTDINDIRNRRVEIRILSK
jgi:outer membrane protein OmpA-like peptidoglycan-associated protein